MATKRRIEYELGFNVDNKGLNELKKTLSELRVNLQQDFDDKSFRNYVRVVAKGISIDVYRKEKKHIENVIDADLTDFRNLSVDEFEVCDLMLLKQAIDAMPESYKSTFYLKYLNELSGAEIAKSLNISEPLVRRRCMLGMQFVRNFVKEAEQK